MKNGKIMERKEEINKIFNETTDEKLKKELEHEYNILTCREIINDYLYYGYGLRTFLENDYECAKKLNIDTLKQLFKEQTETLGNM